jgi:hypothetical protein
MDWAPLLITLILGITSLVIALERAMARIKLARRRIDLLRAKERQHAEKMRKIALRSLHLKRAVAGQDERTAELVREIERLETEVRKAVDPAHRIIVLEERKGGIEQSFLATVSCDPPDPAAVPWTGTRRYLLWAASEDLARTRLARKMPAEQGYKVHSVKPIPLSPKTGIPLSIPA